MPCGPCLFWLAQNSVSTTPPPSTLIVRVHGAKRTPDRTLHRRCGSLHYGVQASHAIVFHFWRWPRQGPCCHLFCHATLLLGMAWHQETLERSPPWNNLLFHFGSGPISGQAQFPIPVLCAEYTDADLILVQRVSN